MRWLLGALVCVALFAAVVPRFGWGAVAQERRQARADTEQIASSVCKASACDARQRGPFASFAGSTFWDVRIERRGQPVLCFQLTPDVFRPVSPRFKSPGVFRATSGQNFIGVAKA